MNIDPIYIELVELYLDNESTKTETELLFVELSRNPDLMIYFNQAKLLDKSLAGTVESYIPPGDLSEQILGSLNINPDSTIQEDIDVSRASGVAKYASAVGVSCLLLVNSSINPTKENFISSDQLTEKITSNYIDKNETSELDSESNKRNLHSKSIQNIESNKAPDQLNSYDFEDYQDVRQEESSSVLNSVDEPFEITIEPVASIGAINFSGLPENSYQKFLSDSLSIVQERSSFIPKSASLTAQTFGNSNNHNFSSTLLNGGSIGLTWEGFNTFDVLLTYSWDRFPFFAVSAPLGTKEYKQSESVQSVVLGLQTKVNLFSSQPNSIALKADTGVGVSNLGFVTSSNVCLDVPIVNHFNLSSGFGGKYWLYNSGEELLGTYLTNFFVSTTIEL